VRPSHQLNPILDLREYQPLHKGWIDERPFEYKDELTPANFQFVGNLVDAIDVPKRLLSHLLLEVRVDDAPQGDAAIAGFKTQTAASNVGVSLQRREYTIVQGHVDHLSFVGSLKNAWGMIINCWRDIVDVLPNSSGIGNLH
jgi:hypothetical protein